MPLLETLMANTSWFKEIVVYFQAKPGSWVCTGAQEGEEKRRVTGHTENHTPCDISTSKSGRYIQNILTLTF